MSFDLNFLLNEITQFIWPFFRISSMLLVITIIGTKLVPVRIRLMFSIVLTFAVFRSIPVNAGVEFFSIGGLLIVAREIIIGISLGFIMQLVFQAFIIGGQLIGMQAGLGFATMVDPANSESVPFVSQLYLMLITLIYLSIDGHLLTLEIVIKSFDALPIGQIGLSMVSLWSLIEAFKWVFVVGVLVALPAVIALLVMNVSFGIMTRAAPQLNIFTVGFPITLTFGLFIMYLTLPVAVRQFELIFSDAIHLMQLMIYARQ